MKTLNKLPFGTTLAFSFILTLLSFPCFSKTIAVNDTIESTYVYAVSCDVNLKSHAIEVSDEVLNLPEGLSLQLFISKIESSGNLYIDDEIIEENSILPINEEHKAYDLYLPTGGVIYYGLRIIGTLEEGEKYPCKIQFYATLGECGNTTTYSGWEEDSCEAVTPIINGLHISETKTELFYPNPVANTANIKFTRDLNNASISIYNFDNKVVLFKQGLYGNSIEIDVTSLPKGNYFYTVIQEGVLIDKNKFQIQP